MLLTALLTLAAAQEPAVAQVPGEYLKPLLDFSRLTGPPSAGESTVVRRGTTAAAGELVLEQAGAGVLARIWTPAARGKLEFRFGGAEEPGLVLDLEDPASHPSFGGPLVQRLDGALDLQVPIPFSDGLRVTATAAGLAYRCELRTGLAAEEMEDADSDFWQRHAGSYELVDGMLERGEFLVQPRLRTTSMGRVRTNSRITGQVKGSGLVHGFRIEVVNADELDLGRLLRGVRLRIKTDDKVTLNLPLGDYFAASSALPAGPSHLLRVVHEEHRGVTFDSFLPIPFGEEVRVVLLNESFEVPLLRLHVYYAQVDPGPWRLHGAWQLQEDRSGAFDCLLLDADGPGKLLAAAVALRGEGFTGAVDPSGFFGLPPGELRARRGPFGGVGIGNGWTSFDRSLVGAQPAFEDSLRLELPLDLGEREVDLATLALWYAPAEAEHRMGPLPGAPERALR